MHVCLNIHILLTPPIFAKGACSHLPEQQNTEEGNIQIFQGCLDLGFCTCDPQCYTKAVLECGDQVVHIILAHILLL